MSKKNLVRITKRLELSFREAKTVSDVVGHIRSLNRENPLMWGCYRKAIRRGFREFVLVELITPGRNFLSVIMSRNTYAIKNGPAKITIFVDCNVQERKGAFNGNFRRELDVKIGDSAWEEAVSCFGECARNGHDLMSLFLGQK